MLAARRFLFIATVGGIPAATYDCDFTTLTTPAGLAAAGWTYSRTGVAQYVDSSTGNTVYNRHNLCLQSQNMSVTWSQNNVTVTYPVAGQTAPDGTSTVSRMNENTIPGSGHNIGSNNAGVASLRDFVCTASVYAKEDTASTPIRPTVIVNFTAGLASRYTMSFDLRNGVPLGSPSIMPGTEYGAHGMDAVGNGWYRCWIRMKVSYAAAANLAQMIISGAPTGVGIPPTLQANGGTIQYNGAGATAGYFLWGAQIEVANAPRDYIPTTTAQIYWPRFDATNGLLLETSTTNLLNWSQAFLTSGGSSMNWVYTSCTTSTGSVSPDGLTTAVRFTHSGAGPQATVIASGPVGTTNNRCLSFWARRVTGTGNAWYTTTGGVSQIPIAGLSSSWQRFEYVYTNANHQVGFGMDVAGDAIEVWGIQLEINGWPSSYKHTATTQVNIASDAIEMLAAQATFLNASAGSLVSEYAIVGAGAAGSAVAQFVRVGQGGASSWYALGAFTVGGTAAGARETEGWNPLWHFSTSTYTNLLTAWTSGQYKKAGFSYTLGTNFKGFLSGTASANFTPSASMTTLNKIDLACQRLGAGGTVPVSGTARVGQIWIKRLRYWNTMLSDADMTTLTT